VKKAPTSTDAVHAGEPERMPFDAVPEAIVQTSTYTFASSDDVVKMTSGESEHLEYGRYDNPTCRAVEKRMAALEGTEDALIFSSGMAALATAVLAIVKHGQHVVLFRDCYRMSRELVTTRLAQFGVSSTLVEPCDIAGLEKALKPETRLVISEAPTNPYLRTIDLEKMVAVCKGRRGLKTLVDATFATPILSRPTDHGVDLVVHSATKYIGGHHDVLAGFVCGNNALVSAIRDLRGVLGSVCDPHAAFLVARGMKTLAIRVERASATAQRIAEHLEKHPKVERVHYPGLASHPDHAIAKRQMKAFGGVVSFVVKGGFEPAKKMVDGAKLAKIGPSFGGPETLIEQPAVMSFYGMSAEERAAAGIEDGLVRLAVGLEEAEDLVSDLDQALAGV
jgi:cystathionine gamma-synthase